MDFNNLKQTLKTKVTEGYEFVMEKTEPQRTWVKEHKLALGAIGLGMTYGVVAGIAEKKGFKNGVSVGLGENIMRNYNRKIVDNVVDQINDAGEGGVYYTDSHGREVNLKSSKVERL